LSRNIVQLLESPLSPPRRGPTTRIHYNYSTKIYPPHTPHTPHTQTPHAHCQQSQGKDTEASTQGRPPSVSFASLLIFWLVGNPASKGLEDATHVTGFYISSPVHRAHARAAASLTSENVVGLQFFFFFCYAAKKRPISIKI